MELVYITRAIRRYWWATAGLFIAGLAVGLLVGSGSGNVYQTEARVLVGGPAESFSSSTDREVQNQLVLFESVELADRVAEVTGIPAREVLVSSEFRQIPGSDVIAVMASNSSPERAQAIANAYVDSYMAAREDAVRSTSITDLDAIDETIETTADNIDQVNAQIEEAMAPFVAAVAQDPSALLPTIDQIAPRLATQREVLLTQYSLALQRRAEAEDANNSFDIGSQVVQVAALPDTAGSDISLRFLAAVFAGAVFGVLAAIALARISPRVLDEDELVEVLGAPLAATMPKVKDLRSLDHQLELPVPASIQATIRELCVSAEAAASPGEALTVVVTGTMRRSGATTLALAMAKQFALGGTDVLLIDADTSHSDHPGLSAVVGEETSGVFSLVGGNRKSTRSASSLSDAVIEFGTNTDEPSQASLHFAGLGESVRPERRLRRQEASTVLTAAAANWPVVVVDAGPLMDSASSLQFAQLADVVVLAVPIRHQRRSSLAATARALRSSVGQLLVVSTTLPHSSPRSRPARHHQSPPSDKPATGVAIDDELARSPARTGPPKSPPESPEHLPESPERLPENNAAVGQDGQRRASGVRKRS